MRIRRVLTVLVLAIASLAACTSTRSDPASATATRSPEPTSGQNTNASSTAPVSSPTPARSTPSRLPLSSDGVPRFSHIVVVMLENHAYSEIVGSGSAPFINSLARSGAVMTQSYAITHPSEPNYLALFSGSTQGLTNDACPVRYSGPTVATSLRASGYSFVGYSEGLPKAGFTGCTAGSYVRRHAPWTDFPALPASVNEPMTAFPTTFSRLPSLAFVIPDLLHDMHDGTVAQADTWLHRMLGGYVTWARTHGSLLVITTDEDDKTSANHIATLFSGADVKAGRYSTRIDHYSVLRTLESAFGVSPVGRSAITRPVTGIWN